MDNKFEKCQLRDTCRHWNCNDYCFPFVFLHGLDGNRGIWNQTGVPKKYQECKADNYPDVSPVNTREAMKRYMNDCLKHVSKGTGMFLFSLPNRDNPLGTGTGKTTTATTIINEFMKKRVVSHFTGKQDITVQPALFIRMADFQNTYNAQFRGTRYMNDEASLVYYSAKMNMKTVELLVIDDVAIRNGTDAFLNELYEIIDHRVTGDKATIYTSNVGLKEIGELLGERIQSRIIGSTHAFPFDGEDHRKKGKVI